MANAQGCELGSRRGGQRASGRWAEDGRASHQPPLAFRGFFFSDASAGTFPRADDRKSYLHVLVAFPVGTDNRVRRDAVVVTLVKESASQMRSDKTTRAEDYDAKGFVRRVGQDGVGGERHDG